MSPGQYFTVRKKVECEAPEHLNGFEQGWLLTREISMRYGKVIQLFTITDNGPKIITTVVV